MATSEERFGGISRLFGPLNFEKLQRAHIAVIGIGGVGSWVAESLARSGVGSLTLCDLDEVCVTNTNRQLVADSTSVGRAKIEVMADRARAIHPEIVVHERFDFLNAENIDELLNPRPDLVVDAIDSLADKVSLALWCARHDVPLVVSGAAGGRRHAEAIVVRPLGKTTHDPLLRRMRRELSREVEPNARIWQAPAVFSTEPGAPPILAAGCETTPSGAMDCRTGFGTASWVTGTVGLMAAGVAIDTLVERWAKE